MSRVFYRYDADHFGDGKVGLRLSEFIEVKKTPKGCWICPALTFNGVTTPIPCYKSNADHWKLVLDESRKKYACETKELALESFIRRKQRQIRILKHQLAIAETALREAGEAGKEDRSIFSIVY